MFRRGKRRGKGFLTIITAFLLLLNASVVFGGTQWTKVAATIPPGTSTASSPQVVLEFAPTTMTIGKDVTMAIRILDVTGLYGAEVHLLYDPTRLQVVDADSGLDGIQIADGTIWDSVDPGKGYRVPAKNEVSVDPSGAQIGRIHYAYSLRETTSTFTGSGTLAAVTFKVIGPTGTASTPTVVSFASDLPSKLSDRNASEIPFVTQPGTLIIDDQPPLTQHTVIPPAPDGDDGWYKTQPKVVLTSEAGAATYFCFDQGQPQPYPQEGIAVPDTKGTILSYYSVDQASNQEITKSLAFRADTVAPTTKDNASAAWTNQNVVVTLTAIDATSGVVETIYDADGHVPTTVYSTPFTIEDSGQHQLMYFSRDLAGNVEQTKTGTAVRIDKMAPVTTDDAPAGWMTQTFAVHLTAADDKLSPQTTYYTLDGGDPTTSATRVNGNTVSVSQDGVYQLKYYTEDEAGNREAVKTRELKLDTQAPILLSSRPEEGGFTNQTRPEIRAVLNDVSGVDRDALTLRLDQTDVSTFAYDPATRTISFEPQADLRDGEHVVAINVRSDVAGNGPTTLEFRFTVKTDKPGIISASHDGGGRYLKEGDRLTVTMSGTRGMQAWFTVENSPQQPVEVSMTEDPTGTYRGVYTVGPSEDFTGKVTVFLVDRAQNMVSRDLSPVVADSVKPQVAISSIEGTQAARAIRGNYQDTNIDRIEITVGNEAPVRAALDTAAQTFSASITLKDGANQVTVTASDKAGNSQTATTVSYLEFNPPTIEIRKPVAFEKKEDAVQAFPVEFEIILSDDMSGVDLEALVVKLDGDQASGATPTPDTDGRVTVTFARSTLREGPHTLWVGVKDKAQNSAEATRNFQVDTKAVLLSVGHNAREILKAGDTFKILAAGEWRAAQTLSYPTVTYSFTTAAGTRTGNLTPSDEIIGLYVADYTVAAGDDTPAEGTSITIKLVDALGHEASQTITSPVRIDTTAPQVSGAIVKVDGSEAKGGVILTAGQVLRLEFDSESGLALATMDVGGLFKGINLTETAGGEAGISRYSAEIRTEDNLNMDPGKIAVHLRDAAGNQSDWQWEHEVAIDTLPPQANIFLTPERPDGDSGWYKTAVTATLSTFGADLDNWQDKVKVKYRPANGQVENALSLTPSQDAQGGLTGEFRFDLAQGDNVYTYAAWDKAGNLVERTFQARVDTVPPEKPAITNPASGTLVKTRLTPDLSGTAEVGSKVEIWVKGPAANDQFELRRIVESDGSGQFSVGQIRLREGANTIKAVAVDQAGNRSQDSLEITVTRDTTAPSFKISDLNTTGGTFKVTSSEVLKSDPQTGAALLKVTVKLRGDGANDPWQDVTPTITATADPQVWQATYRPDPSKSNLIIKVEGTDLAGNVGQSEHIERLISKDGDKVTTDTLDLETDSNDFSQDVTLEVTPLLEENLTVAPPEGTELVGTPYDIKASAQPNAGEKVKITFKLVAQGLLPSQLAVYYFDVTGQLQRLQGEVKVIAEAQGIVEVTAYLEHFSQYAVLADTTPPTLTVKVADLAGNELKDGQLVNTNSVRVSGSTEAGAALMINGSPVQVDNNGTFAADSVLLPTEGANTITVVATDAAGNRAAVERTVVRDTIPPKIRVNSLTGSPVFTTSNSVHLSGQLTLGDTQVQDTGSKVTIKVSLGSTAVTTLDTTNGLFDLDVPLTQEGEQYTINITAVDQAGNRADQVDIAIVRDNTPPVINLSRLPPVTSAGQVRVSGTLVEAVGIKRVLVNGAEASVSGNDFSNTVTLNQNAPNRITVLAQDRAGNTSTEVLSITHDSSVPDPGLAQAGMTTYTNQDLVTISGVATSAGKPAVGASVAFKKDGSELAGVSKVLDETGAYSANISLVKNSRNQIEVVVTATNGLSASANRTIVHDDIKPALSAQADTINTTNSTATISGTASDTNLQGVYLYTNLAVGEVPVFDQAHQLDLAAGRYSRSSLTLALGANRFSVFAVDLAGNFTRQDLAVTRSEAGGGYVSPSPSPVPKLPAPVTKTASPGTKTTIATADGSFQVVLPEGALDREVEVNLKPKEGPKVSLSGLTAVGRALELTATARADGSAVNRFRQSLVVSIQYTDADVANVNLDAVGLHYENTVWNVWVRLPATHDPAARTFTTWVSHFTNFALIADTSGEAPSLSLPAASDSDHFQVTGKAKAGTQVEVVVNNVSQGIVTAATDGSFSLTVKLQPGKNQIFAIASSPSGKRASGEETVHFRPVLRDIAGHWAETDIRTLVDLGVVAGYGDGKFGPEDKVSRAQFAVMLMRALGYEPKAAPVLKFADAGKIPDWAAGHVATAIEKGIVTGYGEDNTFRGEAKITREEITAMVVRALKYKGTIATDRKTGLTFKDAAAVQDWARESVQTAAEYEIVKGYEDGSFGPARNATRAEAGTMILRWMNLK